MTYTCGCVIDFPTHYYGDPPTYCPIHNMPEETSYGRSLINTLRAVDTDEG